MGVDQIGAGKIARNTPEARVSTTHRSIEDTLVRSDEGRARNKREPTIRKGFPERSPRYGIDLPPSVRAEKDPIDERKLLDFTHQTSATGKGLAARAAIRSECEIRGTSTAPSKGAAKSIARSPPSLTARERRKRCAAEKSRLLRPAGLSRNAAVSDQGPHAPSGRRTGLAIRDGLVFELERCYLPRRIPVGHRRNSRWISV